MAIQFEEFADGLAMPEGPVVMADGSVIVVEIAAGRLTRCWPGGRKETVATPGGGPNGAAMGADGALYVCNSGGVDHDKMCHHAGPGYEGRLERIDMATGKVERLYDRCDGEALSAPNDIVIDAAGDIWFSDLGKYLGNAHELGGLYHAKPDGSGIRCAERSIEGYNGVGLSPDGAVVYAAGAFGGRMVAFDAKLRSPKRLVGNAPDFANFDSLAVTAAGSVCVACPFENEIVTYTPSGERTRTSTPEGMSTNIAFGGDDMRTAYITMTHSGQILKARWSEPGLRLHFNG